MKTKSNIASTSHILETKSITNGEQFQIVVLFIYTLAYLLLACLFAYLFSYFLYLTFKIFQAHEKEVTRLQQAIDIAREQKEIAIKRVRKILFPIVNWRRFMFLFMTVQMITFFLFPFFTCVTQSHDVILCFSFQVVYSFIIPNTKSSNPVVLIVACS